MNRGTQVQYVLLQHHYPKSQRKEVLDIVLPTVKTPAMYAPSKVILQTLLYTLKIRRQAVKRILAIRAREGDSETQLGNSFTGIRTPDISCDATRIGDLINRSEDASELPLT